MPKITFGYIKVGTEIVPDAEQAEKIRRLFENYASGMSVSKSGAAAGLHVESHILDYMLKNQIYRGRGKYPPIISAELHARAMAVRAANEDALRKKIPKRIKGNKKPIIQISTRFELAKIGEARDGLTPAEYAELVYNAIHPINENDKHTTI